nr:MAG TPA: hypothetical protein [Caudoviricetes sp.]
MKICSPQIKKSPVGGRGCILFTLKSKLFFLCSFLEKVIFTKEIYFL